MADGSVTYLLDEEAANEVRKNDGPLLERLGDGLQLPIVVTSWDGSRAGGDPQRRFSSLVLRGLVMGLYGQRLGLENFAAIGAHMVHTGVTTLGPDLSACYAVVGGGGDVLIYFSQST